MKIQHSKPISIIEAVKSVRVEAPSARERLFTNEISKSFISNDVLFGRIKFR